MSSINLGAVQSNKYTGTEYLFHQSNQDQYKNKIKSASMEFSLFKTHLLANKFTLLQNNDKPQSRGPRLNKDPTFTTKTFHENSGHHACLKFILYSVRFSFWLKVTFVSLLHPCDMWVFWPQIPLSYNCLLQKKKKKNTARRQQGTFLHNNLPCNIMNKAMFLVIQYIPLNTNHTLEASLMVRRKLVFVFWRSYSSSGTGSSRLLYWNKPMSPALTGGGKEESR